MPLVLGSHTEANPNALNLSTYELSVNFSAQQINAPPEQKLGVLFAQKIARKEFFYGIELSAHSYGAARHLDYNNFNALLPLFTSIVWLGQDYWNVTPIENVPAVRFARKLQQRTVILPHFTCYRVDEARAKEFADSNFSNVLALSGDQKHDEQMFKHATALVLHLRKARGDTISIGVGGYPERHSNTKSLDEDMQFLRQKVNAGADFIITQNCYCSEILIKFIRNCRAYGIDVPIIIGVYVPENMSSFLRMNELTNAQMPPEDLARYKELQNRPEEFNAFAVAKAVQMLTEVFNSNLNVYGVQFFSLNRFQNIQSVVTEILAQRDFVDNEIK